MTPVDRIAVLVLEHSYDHEARECMCGYRVPAGPGPLETAVTLAEHVAEQVSEKLVALLVDDAKNMGEAWGGGRAWLTTGTHVAELVADWISETLTERAS